MRFLFIVKNQNQRQVSANRQGTLPTYHDSFFTDRSAAALHFVIIILHLFIGF